MKTVVIICPRKCNIKFLYDFGCDHSYTYTPTSAFLKVLNEIEWLQSKVVSISNKNYDFGFDSVDKDVIEIEFEYKWKERKLFHRVITKLLMRKDIAKTYFIKMI